LTKLPWYREFKGGNFFLRHSVHSLVVAVSYPVVISLVALNVAEGCWLLCR